LHPIVFLLGGVVTVGQVFATRQVRSAFVRSGDEQLARVDVARVMAAAVGAFLRWFRAVVVVRFLLITFGSVVVIVLLTLPSSSSHY